ncbi:MAG TPA: TM2 domain-containing protein [Clostridia bacterium]|nr:TM2 domain-containing protein [Clostridia bacterium]
MATKVGGGYMKGTVLGFNEVTGEGVITGSDQNRYNFKRADWSGTQGPIAGYGVDFVGENGAATQIYVDPAVSGSSSAKSKVAAGLLGLFFGAFGVHKFYLGSIKAGIIMALVSFFGFILFGIPTMVMGVIAFIEGIIYLTKSEPEFEAIYVRGKKAWF